jgi:hypothetical protein
VGSFHCGGFYRPLLVQRLQGLQLGGHELAANRHRYDVMFAGERITVHNDQVSSSFLAILKEPRRDACTAAPSPLAGARLSPRFLPRRCPPCPPTSRNITAETLAAAMAERSVCEMSPIGG